MATREECDSDFARAVRDAPPEGSREWSTYWLNWYKQPTPTAEPKPYANDPAYLKEAEGRN